MRTPVLSTERLKLFKANLEDVDGFFELDSNPKVLEFIGTDPLTKKEQSQQVIEMLQEQYLVNGTARLTVRNKETGEFMGWCGIKLMTEETQGEVNFYELGYRFIPRYWGKGYASEAAKACLDFAFDKMGAKKVVAFTDLEHKASQRVLEKLGFKIREQFVFYDSDCYWHEVFN